jgi:Asp-tRNA(Asn)/Glu-tRNA(Gln) amidotransferase A subunit family amidase
VPLSLGAQTGGSVIRPASFTGVFAVKPTHNAISPEGAKTFASTFDTLGFFARSIEDLQLVAGVFDLTDDEVPKDIALTDASVALIKTPMWSEAGPGTVAAVQKAVAILQANGVTVEEVSLPAELADVQVLNRMQKVVVCGEAQAAFLREYRADKENLDPEVRALVENSARYTHKERLQALDWFASMRPIADKLVAGYSAIITPSVIDEAPLGLEDMGSPAFNTLWTVSLVLCCVCGFSLSLLATNQLTKGTSYARRQYTCLCRTPRDACRSLPRWRQTSRSASVEHCQGLE